jgi:4-amino-4-deoxy-L-arabinose transferase-like glycosyltransferase
VSNRRELVLALLILAGAFLVRGWGVSGTTIDHFDEGVYSFSALGLSDASQPRVMYPSQEIFSPPVYFALGAGVTRAFGIAPDIALMFISIFFGALTALVVWQFVRAEFGAAAGLTAAAIIAFNPFHIAFSRSALTDITFTFWFTLGIATLVTAIERNSWKWSILAGLATGVAWNTKYHGWFVLLIGLSALLPYARRLRATGQPWKPALMKWSAAGFVAFVTYLPWMIYLRTREGGYEALAKHYLGHLRTAWIHNFVRYAEMLAFFETPLGRVAIAAAPLLALALIAKRPAALNRLLIVAAAVGASALLLGAAGTALLLSVIATPWLLRNQPSYRTWVLFAWAAIWILAAPIYNPYARLILPFVVATAIGAAVGFTRVLEWCQQPAVRTSPRVQLAVVSAFAIIVFFAGGALPRGADPWRARGMSGAAAEFSQEIPEGSRVIAMIEPTIAYYLHRSGRPAFERTSQFSVLDTLSTPAYVITGTYVRRSPRLQQQLTDLSDRLTALGVAKVIPYDVRLMDDLAPRRARKYRAHPDSTFDLHLFRYNPPAK